MVTTHAFILLSIFSLTAYSNGISDEHRASASPSISISKVKIEKNAAWSDNVSSDESPESCVDFILAESDVRRFFTVARKATHVEYNHDLLMSRCFANGHVFFENGKSAEWEIDKARRGILVFPDKSASYFYCDEKCSSKAYMEPCDIDCIHE